jgi:hypothetical protein
MQKRLRVLCFKCSRPKPLGPDGHLAHFFQKHWSLYGEEIAEIVIRLLKGDDSPDKINKMFIVLIPKEKKPTNLSQ